MSLRTLDRNALVDCATAGQPADGQSVSGDLHVVQPFTNGVLLAVIDGVGHGEEATAAARNAASVLRAYAREPVLSLLRRCHQAIVETRGAVMTVASLNARDETITWVGVGNVEGRLLRADTSNGSACAGVLLHGGLVGYQLPPLQATVLPLAPGDLVVFATDGIRADFDQGLNRTASPQQLADQILRQHFKGNDDALVLAVRYLGARHG